MGEVQERETNFTNYILSFKKLSGNYLTKQCLQTIKGRKDGSGKNKSMHQIILILFRFRI